MVFYFIFFSLSLLPIPFLGLKGFYIRLKWYKVRFFYTFHKFASLVVFILTSCSCLVGYWGWFYCHENYFVSTLRCGNTGRRHYSCVTIILSWCCKPLFFFTFFCLYLVPQAKNLWLKILNCFWSNCLLGYVIIVSFTRPWLNSLGSKYTLCEIVNILFCSSYILFDTTWQ